MLATATPSAAIDFSGVSLPFNVQDLLQSAMSLMGPFTGFILLGVVIVFTPKLIAFFKNVVNGKSKVS